MADSKRATAISIMNDNADKAMSQVVELIADAINVTIPNAKSYYRYIVKHKLAAGKSETATRGAPAPKAQKAAKPVKVKAAPKAPAKGRTAKAVVAKDENSTRSAEDLSAIKAANLKRMKEVSARLNGKKTYLPGQMAAPAEHETPAGWTAEGARAEVAQIYKDLESFDTPKFLTKDALKAMV
jgi:predicted lipid-binding transport protein (Tim44 family)